MAAKREQSFKSEDVLRLFFANESSSSEASDSDDDFQQYLGTIVPIIELRERLFRSGYWHYVAVHIESLFSHYFIFLL